MISGFWSCKNESFLESEFVKTENLMDQSLSREYSLPTIKNGILQFSNEDHVWDYHDYLDNYRSSYNYNDDLFEDASDPAADNFENQLSFSSLRAHYEDLKNNASGSFENLSLVQNDHLDQYVFNDLNEIQVGTEIYKYFKNDLVAQVNVSDEAELNILRSGQLPSSKVALYDENAKSYVSGFSPSEVLTPKAGCFSIVTYESYGEQDLLFKVTNFSSDGAELSCGFTITMTSSDGSTSSTSTDQAFLFPNLAPTGDCFDFDYSFTVTYTFCDPCVDGTTGSFSGTGTVKDVCSSIICFQDGQDEDEVWEETFNHEGRNWKATAFKGYKTQKTFWSKPYVMGRLEFFRQRKNGKWARKKPNHSLNVILDGSVRIDGCEGPESFVDIQESKKTRKLTAKRRFSDVDQIAGRLDENVFVDFKVFHSSSSNPDIELEDIPVFD